jgi:DNA-binding response OmpR family regulator
MAKILVVEDDKDLAGMLEDTLVSEHHTVELSYDGSQAWSLLQVYTYDAVVLDWDIPGISGIELLSKVRAKGNNTPILMLTGKGSLDNKEQGLDSGADDYLTKPFQAREFTARLRALLRRGTGLTSNILRARDLELDPQSFSVTKNGTPLNLVQREFQVLEFFMRNPNRVFSADALLGRIWKADADASHEAVRTCLTRLRKKIDSEGQQPLITTIHGVGYKLVP